MTFRSSAVNALNISIDTIPKKNIVVHMNAILRGKKIIILYIFYNVIIVNIK